ncbi:uncharacterized protein MYCFIDRAFT_174176 [Pseudocercospora fijiensis CIRAD86]|uniref:Uncharacterized protein n=1 Tax=Pseudocercospora fijiensis (strain CIRAD86) TaxID=383855 RepID=M2ZUC8_PSEFD|nr:uncharacterized protein MYCFIDRAFT_174176 [Pseudocercospora fijiensis CIRAD86]EME82609.1 hypothetical protein MYCFIDRAFT_174176 [Pseudocercospora fijiensis CIRAD86]
MGGKIISKPRDTDQNHRASKLAVDSARHPGHFSISLLGVTLLLTGRGGQRKRRSLRRQGHEADRAAWLGCSARCCLFRSDAEFCPLSRSRECHDNEHAMFYATTFVLSLKRSDARFQGARVAMDKRQNDVSADTSALIALRDPYALFGATFRHRHFGSLKLADFSKFSGTDWRSKVAISKHDARLDKTGPDAFRMTMSDKTGAQELVDVVIWCADEQPTDNGFHEFGLAGKLPKNIFDCDLPGVWTHSTTSETLGVPVKFYGIRSSSFEESVCRQNGLTRWLSLRCDSPDPKILGQFYPGQDGGPLQVQHIEILHAFSVKNADLMLFQGVVRMVSQGQEGGQDGFGMVWEMQTDKIVQGTRDSWRGIEGAPEHIALSLPH